jgi:pyruvate dehydrogenase kinase 2/3/4
LQIVVEEYAQSFRDVLAFERANPKDPKVMSDFAHALINVRERHTNTVIIMAEAVLEMKLHQSSEENGNGNGGSGRKPRYMDNIQYFLDRLYTSRISTRMLINQHTALFTNLERVDSNGRQMVGTIDMNCEIEPIVKQAYLAARDICEYHYMVAPELDLKLVNGVPGDETVPEKISFVYVPSHLYHMLFELIKNSMRATIERYEDSTVYLPPVKGKFNKPNIGAFTNHII